jgi:hypothetical protein
MRARFAQPSASPATRVSRRFAATLTAISIAGAGASLVVGAGSAMAAEPIVPTTTSTVTTPAAVAPLAPASPISCTANPNISYGWNGANAFAAKLLSGAGPCYDVTVNLTTYSVPVGDAATQDEYATTTLTFPAYSTVPAPTCGSYEAAAYAGAIQNSTDSTGAIGRLAGDLVKLAPCAVTDLSAGPSFADEACNAGLADAVGYTIPSAVGVEFFAKLDAANPVAATGGSFVPVAVGHSVTVTAVAIPGYPAPVGYPAAGWTHTFLAPAANCSTLGSHTVVVHLASRSASGTVAETCQTGGGNEAYTVTLVSPTAGGASGEFQLSVNGQVVATSGAIAAGASYVVPGALDPNAAALFGAQFMTTGAATWTPVILTGSESTFPCVGHNQPELAAAVVTKPAAAAPTVAQLAAALPFTGTPTGWLALVATTLLGVGALLVYGTRRRDAELATE